MAQWKHAAILALAGTSHAAAAQDFPVVDWGPMMQTEAMNGVIEDVGRSEGRKSQPSDHKSKGPAVALRASLSQALANHVTGRASPVAPVTASYVPSAAVRERLAGIMGDAAAPRDTAKRAEMRRLVMSGQAIREYQRIAPMLGLRVNDAIDAYAFYLLAQWGVANDHRADVTRAQAAGVRRQAASAYAGIAGQLGSDALRQEFGEMLVIQGVVLAGAHEAAVRSGDDAATRRYAALARRGGEKVFAMDPAGIALTDAGFRPK